MAGAQRILYCDCAYADVVPADVKGAARSRLREAGVDFEAVPDLCELAARRDPALTAIAESGDAVIIACYPRAVRWLFAYAGAPLPETGVEIVNMREEGSEAILGRLRAHFGVEQLRNQHPASPAHTGPQPKPGQWVPWFPVIDRSRCTDCQQCLNFCLFGVYAFGADGKVEVKNPANCKTNCPACARICPQVAIIFPKHKTGPINGDEVTPEHLASREVRVDPKRLGRGDVYAALRRRSERARAAAAEPPVTEDQAAKLCPCMTEQLEKELGIPPEVLKTLSLSDIQAKLRAARGQ